MKKTLRILSALNFILLISTVVMLILVAFKPDGFGEFLLQTYEDVTSDVGHTVEGLYGKLQEILLIVLAISCLFEVILYICDEVHYNIHCTDDTINEDDEVVAPSEGDDVKYRTRIQFGRRNKEPREEKPEKKSKPKKEKKSKNEVKEEIKEHVEEKVEEQVKEIEERVVDAKDKARADFLAQLRNRRR